MGKVRSNRAPYGALVGAPKEALRMWHSRDREPEELGLCVVDENAWPSERGERTRYVGVFSSEAQDDDLVPLSRDDVWRLTETYLCRYHALVLRMRFVHEMTLAECALAIGVSPARVQQVQALSLQKLRVAFAKRAGIGRALATLLHPQEGY